jgi:hypothetical protein
MMKVLRNHRQTQELTLNKTTLRVLSELQMVAVNGGDPITAGICVTTLDYPCPNPGFATTACP